MPSRAQIVGAGIVKEILAPAPKDAIRIRNITDHEGHRVGLGMRGRAFADGSPGVAVTVPAHRNRGFAGEYNQTITVPLDDRHPSRAHAAGRLAQLIGRWIEVDRVSRSYAAAVEAADGQVDRASPTPARMINCPLILRTALDHAGADADQRLDLADREGRLQFDGIEIRIDDVDQDDPKLWSALRCPQRSVRRATITGPGFKWSQGVNQHYLLVDQILPATIVNAIAGMPLGLVVDMPWLRRTPGVAVNRAARTKIGTRFELSRAHGHLAGDVPAIGHETMRPDR